MARGKIVLPVSEYPLIEKPAAVEKIVNCVVCNAETPDNFLLRGRPYCHKCYVRKPLYSHGLPFSQKLAENIDDLKERIKIGKASLIIIDGGVGEGKTTLAVHIAEYFSGKEIIFSEQLALGGRDFRKKLNECYLKGHRVIIYDEAGDFASRGALTKLNAELNRTFETFRAYQIFVILCLPLFATGDKSLMIKQIIRCLIHVYDRTEKDGSFSAYSLNRMFYIKDKLKTEIVPASAFKFVVPNYYGHSLDLSPQRAAELDKYTTAGKLKINEHDAGGLMARDELAIKLDRSLRWVEMKIKEYDIKTAKVYDGKKFYSQEAYRQLKELVGGEL